MDSFVFKMKLKFIIMKRLLFLLMIVFLPLCMNAQRLIRYDSIPYPAGSDTTVYVFMFDIYNWSLEYDYKNLSQTDGLLDLGACRVADGSVFNRLDDLRLPFTLADSTQGFEKSNYSFRFLAIKYTPVTGDSGTQFYWIYKK